MVAGAGGAGSPARPDEVETQAAGQGSALVVEAVVGDGRVVVGVDVVVCGWGV